MIQRSDRPWLARVVFAVFAGAALAGCGSDSSTGSSEVASVTLSANTASLVPGETRQLVATARAANGAALSGREITWTSSSETVATVSESGLVTAVALGSATITATSEGREGTAAITVWPPIEAVEVSPAAAWVGVGQTVQLTGTPRDSDGDALAGRQVIWTSSNTTVATVAGTGLVSARALGTATITATSEGIQGTATVNVTDTPPGADDAPPVLVSLSVNPDTANISGGEVVVTVTLHVTDAGTGVQSVGVNLVPPTPPGAVGQFKFAPSSGTRTDGTWIMQLRIPAGAQLGTWLLTDIKLTDIAGNITLLQSANLQGLGFEYRVQVRN